MFTYFYYILGFDFDTVFKTFTVTGRQNDERTLKRVVYNLGYNSYTYLNFNPGYNEQKTTLKHIYSSCNDVTENKFGRFIDVHYNCKYA